eukprot:510837-Alexandrium_andersonii.AAC.1
MLSSSALMAWRCSGPERGNWLTAVPQVPGAGGLHLRRRVLDQGHRGLQRCRHTAWPWCTSSSSTCRRL